MIRAASVAWGSFSEAIAVSRMTVWASAARCSSISRNVESRSVMSLNRFSAVETTWSAAIRPPVRPPIPPATMASMAAGLRGRVMIATRSCCSWRSPMCCAVQTLTLKLDTRLRRAMEGVYHRAFGPFAKRAYRGESRPILTNARMMEQDEIKRRIIELQVEHRDLDAAIERLSIQPGVDELALRRMKKRKLQIKDAVTLLEMLLVPDIPA